MRLGNKNKQGLFYISLGFHYLCPRKISRSLPRKSDFRNMNRPKIIIDDAIPFLSGVLEPWADVAYLPAAAIGPEEVRPADALVIRTRTRCDSRLLAGSRVRLIATATIGFDHIDTAWCAARGIRVATAAGCNARGVLQWIAAALEHLARTGGWQPGERTLGIVGVGHVGSLVKQYAEQWGFRILCCDPPREAREHLGFLPLETVARASDLLTFHTPLDATTRHLADRALLAAMKPDAVVINSSRGEVVDGKALLASARPCVLDVWEHEPHIDRRLLDRALLATPHIAGYSLQGKANAAALSVQALARTFSLPLTAWYPPQAARSVPRPLSWQELGATIRPAFDIEAESRRLKAAPETFEQIRDRYDYRREYF